MDRHTQSRLKKERVIWLVTASRNGRPQAVPVWFVWDENSFLIYAVDGVKVNHVKSNPNVELHLNSDEVGNDVVRASGQASVSHASRLDEGYARKYQRDIKNLDMTAEDFVGDYSNAIRVRRLKFH